MPNPRTERRRAADSLSIYTADLPAKIRTKADVKKVQHDRPDWLTKARQRYRVDHENASHRATIGVRAALARDDVAAAHTTAAGRPELIEEIEMARDALSRNGLKIADADCCTGNDGCATCTPLPH